MRWRLGALGAIGILLLARPVWAAEPVAVLTEIRLEEGRVLIKLVGEADWKAPQPLLALRPGDQVRAERNARAVFTYTGGGGAQTVSAANSPYTVQVPTVEGGADRIRRLLTGVTQFLLGKRDEPTYVPLAAKGLGQSAVILLAPRETRLLPGAVTFEWDGPSSLRYTIRVFGPEGPVWEQVGVPLQPIRYPATALRAGVLYSWKLEPENQPGQWGMFHILTASEAARVRASLADLEPATLSGYPPATVVLMRAAFLLQEGLYEDARRELSAGLAADPGEPTLHRLLGHVYDRVGLKSLAAEEFQEAQLLSTQKP